MSAGTDRCPLSPLTSETARAAGHWQRWTMWLIAGLLGFRLAYLFLVPLDLVHDEAYYWDWSRQLSWGYYSKPPMVAWLIGLATRVAGSTTPMVRLPAVLLGTLGLYVMYMLAARLYDARVGFYSALVCAVTPGNAAMSLLMTIDVPLTFFWLLTLYALWRAWERDVARPWWLALATVTCGLGLLSKQTMVAAIAGAYLFVLCSPADRRELRRPGLHVWAAGSLAFLLPVLWWNAQHDWVTVSHTSHHFELASASLGKHLTLSGEFLLGQFGLLSPVTCFLTLAVLGAAGITFRRLPRRERFLLCFSGAPLCGVLVLSILRRVEPNWPAVFYPAGLVLVVAWALDQVTLPLRISTTRALPRAIRVSIIFTLAVYCMPFVSQALDLQQARLDPTIRLKGWHELGSAVSRQVAQLPLPSRTFVVVTTGRAVTSELAFYLDGQPRVYLWNGSPRVVSQYDIWGGPREHAGWDAAILTRPNQAVPPELAQAFAAVHPWRMVEVPISGDRAHRFQVWHATGFAEWPEGGRSALRPRIARSRHLQR